MNPIAQYQNEPRQLERLAAQRQYYSDAKNCSSLQLILGVILPGLFALATLLLPSLSTFAAIYGVLILFTNIVTLDPIVSTKKKCAAEVQDIFDRDVLELPQSEIIRNRSVSEEDISEQAAKYQKSNSLDLLLNWYTPTVSNIDIHVGRILCQRMNVQWDMRIRKSYSNLLFTVITLLIIAVAIAGVFSHLLFAQVILTISSLSPFLQFATSQRARNSEASERLDILRTSFQSVFNLILEKSITPQRLDQFAREAQALLHEHRSRSPLIPDCMYVKSKHKNEQIMKEAIDKLLADVIAAGPLA